MKVLIEERNGGLVDFKNRAEKRPSGAVSSGFRETVWPLPKYLGEGRFRNIEFENGMNLTLGDCRYCNDYHARVEQSSPMITFVFSISGETVTRNPSLDNEFLIRGGESYFHYLPSPVFQRSTVSGKHLKTVVIRIQPTLYHSFMNRASLPFAETFSPTLAADKGIPFFVSHRSTHSMMSALFQLTNCPHEGVVKSIFLESKALELIAYKLEQLYSENTRRPTRPQPTKQDKERIHYVRELLSKNLHNPPSLYKLAQLSGMTHTRLNRGFRSVFGCTVFEYLRNERLEYARLLLCEGKMNNTQIALEAGFCSSSHFSRAFSRRFGIQPGKYRRREDNRF